MRRIIIAVIALLFLAGGGWYWWSQTEDSETMTEHLEHQHDPTNIDYWTCTMHPSVKSSDPGTCPICAMDLVPVLKEGVSTKPEMQMVGGRTITINPEWQRLIGVRMGKVEYRTLKKIIRTVGKVEYDERRLAEITLKIDGWIKELFVDYTGQAVRKGEPLLSIYSPELVTTQREYLLALRSWEKLQNSSIEVAVDGAKMLLQTSRDRLLLWDLSKQQIKELEETGEPKINQIIYSPTDGFVIEKMALQGMRVKPDIALYRIADLSTVWIYADIYENELPLVKVGQEAKVSLTSYPGETFTGKVTHIYPYLNDQTRTVKVRLEFSNPDYKLKPGMYANVELETDMGEKLAVPTEAVLNTGTRQIVFIDKGEGKIEPRIVKLGAEIGEYYEVLESLSEGEIVVTSSNFLIDAESKVQGILKSEGQDN